MAAKDDEEEERLRKVALQNAQSILLARRRAELALERRTEELAHSLAMMRATLESTTDAIIVTDELGKVTDCNRKYVEMWGVPSEVMASAEHRRILEVCGRRFADLDRFLARVDDIYASSLPESYDLLELADGRILERFSRTQLVDGRNVGRVWSFRDITERRRAEETLRKQSEWLRVALSSIGDAVISTDTAGQVTFLNGVAEALIGWTQAEACRRPLPEVFHIINEHTRLAVENPALRALRVGAVVGLANHTILIARDGTERPIDDSAAPMRDESGAIVGAVLVFRDVTERKRAEEGLARVTAESEQRRRLYETILSSTPDFVYVFSLDHRVLYANDSLLTMWGRGWDDAVGKTFLEIGYEPQHAEMHCREIDQVRTTKRPVRGEIPFIGPHGRRIYDYIYVPVLGADGEVEAVAGTTRDVTDRKEAEESLREADRRKDEFIALLAHELRNPLAPLRNGLQVMRLAGGDANAIANARGIMERQLGHMVRLIDDLLDISRISQNKMELRRSRVVLTDIVNSAVETARPAIEEAGHELTVLLPQEAVLLDADLTRLAQVFSNLLTNSAKYTERGGRIWLAAEQRAAEVVVTVRDTGIGIPADSLPRIFDMFSQVDRSMERSTGGLGIGLALVKGLVEMHDGMVTAASDGQGKGSMFTVTLPALESHTEPLSTNPSDPVQTAVGPRRRILVVDDNRDVATSMAMMLKLMGNEIRTAHDGVEAVEVAEQFRPQIILMDVGMPRLNGLDATRRIREQPWGRSITIIALTGWGQEGDKLQSKEAACNGHLVKPVNLHDLENLLAGLAEDSSQELPARKA